MTQMAGIWPAQPRTSVQVRMDDGRIFEAAPGTTLEGFVRAAYPDAPVPHVAALVDGQLRELSMPVMRDMEVTLIDMGQTDGMRIYRRSLSFLLVAAANELFPGIRLHIDHSMSFGGLFCHLEEQKEFSPEELETVEMRMKEMVAEDLPIRREEMPIQAAIAEFRARGDPEKASLLAQSAKRLIAIYEMGEHRHHFHGYMVPRTSYLRWFDLVYYPPGFVLHYPRRQAPTTLQSFTAVRPLVHVFQEYGQWMDVMGVRNLAALNRAIDKGRIREVVLVAEALHEQRIAALAGQIAQRRKDLGLVLIAGPSSSGKTTFARRLAVQLLANGVQPVALGLDDWFVDRERTPVDEKGDHDFETLQAIDLDLFNRQLNQLMTGKRVDLPHFNFKTGQRESGETLQITPNHVILVEGIHGLNPNLVPEIPPERIFRVYVSALTQLNLDRHNRVSTTDTRIFRRIVRDAARRGYSASETLGRWDSVERGERLYIFPYQGNADAMFNSALVYELAVLRALAEPLLLGVDQGTSARVEADRLLSLLRWFTPCSSDLVPDNSILREFIGGSSLAYFRPWQSSDGPEGRWDYR
jgi:uridine kinase